MTDREYNEFEWDQHPVDDTTTLELCKGLKEDKPTQAAQPVAASAAVSIGQSGPKLINECRCVIDSGRYYVEFVQLEQWPDGSTTPYCYTMKPGESLVVATPPTGMVKPRWTGTTWEETGTVDITEAMVEALRTTKLQQANTAAQQAIYAGIELETSEGSKTFALTQEDQINISTLLAQVQLAMEGKESTLDLAKGVPYHADGELCRFWPVEEFVLIAETATAHVFYHQTYCNHLRQYIKAIEGYEGLQAVKYGMELPLELADSMAELLGGQSDDES